MLSEWLINKDLGAAAFLPYPVPTASSILPGSAGAQLLQDSSEPAGILLSLDLNVLYGLQRPGPRLGMVSFSFYFFSFFKKSP